MGKTRNHGSVCQTYKLKEMFAKGGPLSTIPSRSPPQKKVWMKVIFEKINEVDISGNYLADVLVKSKWREPLLDGTSEKTLQDVETSLDSYWSPDIQIENLHSTAEQEIYKFVKFNAKKEAFIWEIRQISGRLEQAMELIYFPFDRQVLMVVASSCQEALVIPDDTTDQGPVIIGNLGDNKMWTFATSSKKNNDEWWNVTREDVLNYLINMELFRSGRGKLSIIRPTISFKCAVQRRPHFFITMYFILVSFFDTLVSDDDIVEFSDKRGNCDGNKDCIACESDDNENDDGAGGEGGYENKKDSGDGLNGNDYDDDDDDERDDGDPYDAPRVDAGLNEKIEDASDSFENILQEDSDFWERVQKYDNFVHVRSERRRKRMNPDYHQRGRKYSKRGRGKKRRRPRQIHSKYYDDYYHDWFYDWEYDWFYEWDDDWFY